MAKLRKEDVEDLDVAALDAVEYSDSDFQDYDGEVPPIGTELIGYVKRMWWTRTAVKPDGSGDDPMLKILWVSDENEGDEEEYNGLPVWLNAPLIASAKFRWAPFLDCYGLTLRDIKSKTYVEDTEDQNGAPIERIGNWKPGQDSDAAWSRIVTGRESYNGSWQARAKEWLALDGAEPEDPDAEPDADAEDTEVELFEDADGNLVDAEGNYYNDDGTPMEDPEEAADPDPEPAPARTSGRRASQKPTAATGARSGRSAKAPAAKPAAARTGGRAARSAPAAPARSGRAAAAAPARPARSTSTKPAARAGRRGSTRAAGSDEEPPF